MGKSYYKNLLRFCTRKNKHGNWHNKLFRRVCKNIQKKETDLSDVSFPDPKEVVDKRDIQDVRAFGKKNKDKIRSYKQLK